MMTMLTLDKSITRDWGIMYAQIWHEAYTREFMAAFGWGYTEVIYEGQRGAISAYRDLTEHALGMRRFIVKQLKNDQEWMTQQARILVRQVQSITEWIASLEHISLKRQTPAHLCELLRRCVQLNIEVGPRYSMALWFPIQMGQSRLASKYQVAIDAAVSARETSEQLGPIVDRLLRRISEQIVTRAGIDKSLSRFLSYEEALRYLNGVEQIRNRELKRRAHYFIITTEGILTENIDSYAMRKGYLVAKHVATQATEVVGITACAGEVAGTVKIVLNKESFVKVESGDILITSMTTPDFVRVLSKVSGIITDEGGITCHAAIAARDRNKPCLIATKHATAVFKDGDRVALVAYKNGNGFARLVRRAG